MGCQTRLPSQLIPAWEWCWFIWVVKWAWLSCWNISLYIVSLVVYHLIRFAWRSLLSVELSYQWFFLGRISYEIITQWCRLVGLQALMSQSNGGKWCEFRFLLEKPVVYKGLLWCFVRNILLLVMALSVMAGELHWMVSSSYVIPLIFLISRDSPSSMKSCLADSNYHNICNVLNFEMENSSKIFPTHQNKFRFK